MFFSVDNIVIEDANSSDQKPFMFDVTLSIVCELPKLKVVYLAI